MRCRNCNRESMEHCGWLACTLAFVVIFLQISSLNGQERGSTRTFERCACDSVKIWLSKRPNGASKLFSYEETVSIVPDYINLSENDRLMRLWVPKHCEMLFGNVYEQKARIFGEDKGKGLIQVKFRDGFSENCLAVKLKCKQRHLCIGVNATQQEVFHSTQRKLLMFKADDSKKTLVHQPYTALLSVVIFCSMVVLIALCGKPEKNSQSSIARDSTGDIVRMVSSKEVKRPAGQPQTQNNSDDAQAEVIEIKVDGSNGQTSDGKSNSPGQLIGDVDLSSLVIVGKDEKICDETSTDGAVFGKEKRKQSEQEVEMEGCEKRMSGKMDEKGNEISEQTRKENSLERNRSNGDDLEVNKQKEKEKKKDKRKEKEEGKETKSKDREKDMRSKRSHTAPSESSEHQSFPKLRISLKGNSSVEQKASKKDKKKSKKKKSDTDSSFETSSPFSGDRRSFVNRELPERPSLEIEDPAGPECVDDMDDDNYETVTTRPRGSKTLGVPSSDSRGSQNDDNDLYDSVDETKVLHSQGKLETNAAIEAESDDYEIVEVKGPLPKAKAAIICTTGGLYESVRVKGSPSTPRVPLHYETMSDDYEEPQLNNRQQRCRSDVFPSNTSAPCTEAQGKANSLDRGMSGATPTPPSVEDLKAVVHAHDNVMSDIEPYTVTIKKGDHIIQEASIVDLAKPQKQRLPSDLSPEEIERLYTKIDKTKQKKDRIETESSRMIMDNVSASQVILINGERTIPGSVAMVSSVEEHEYETLPRKKDTAHETEADSELYEEVIVKVDPKS